MTRKGLRKKLLPLLTFMFVLLGIVSFSTEVEAVGRTCALFVIVAAICPFDGVGGDAV